MLPIKYLIKFVAEEEWADDLLDGKLYMNAAGYYHYLEQGQGDIREASIVPNAGIYIGCEHPIYCLYTVYEEAVINNSITISSTCIDDFHCEHGWFVLIPYKPFMDAFSKIDFKGFYAAANIVQYGIMSEELSQKTLENNSFRHLFIKDPFFSYQNEFRIVVGEAIPLNTYVKTINGVSHNFIDSRNPYDSRTYFLAGGIRRFATKHSIHELKKTPTGYILHL